MLLNSSSSRLWKQARAHHCADGLRLDFLRNGRAYTPEGRLDSTLSIRGTEILYGMIAIAFRFTGVWPQAKYAQVREAGLAPTTSWPDDLYQWVHVEDVARGIRQALEANHLTGFGVYTLGAADTRCPEPSMELVRAVSPRPGADTGCAAPGRAPLLAIDRAREAFGYDPRFRLGD